MNALKPPNSPPSPLEFEKVDRSVDEAEDYIRRCHNNYAKQSIEGYILIAWVDLFLFKALVFFGDEVYASKQNFDHRFTDNHPIYWADERPEVIQVTEQKKKQAVESWLNTNRGQIIEAVALLQLIDGWIDHEQV